MNNTFSSRFGIPIETKEVSVRYDVTDDMREYVLLLIKEQGVGLKRIREIVCKAIKKAPDSNQWSENECMVEEIREYLHSCVWNRIYDIIESFDNELDKSQRTIFEQELNDYFVENGIGWRIDAGVLLLRGNDAFEHVMKSVCGALESKAETSKHEIEEAIKDLSKRENPDLTGAVQHSLAALESLAREVTHEKLTLSKLINKHKELFPTPLGMVVEKMFGYASEHGRHMKEGNEPNFEDAQLLVHISAALCTYLGKKLKNTFDSDNLF